MSNVIQFPESNSSPIELVDDVADTMVRLCMSGHRPPELNDITHDLHPGIGVETFNAGAARPWGIINQDGGAA